MGSTSSGPRSARLLLVAIGASLLSGCAAAGQASPAGGGGQAAAPQPPVVTVSPGNNEIGVRLDRQVTVSVLRGKLDGVVVHPAGEATQLAGRMARDRRTWTSAEPLDSDTRYLVQATASGPGGETTSSVTAFTSMLANRLTTETRPGDGDTVGVGMPISLRFNVGVDPSRQVEFLKHISVASTPPVPGAWHWFSEREVHWRPVGFWPPGTRVTVDGRLRGVEAGSGVWGLGDWTRTFTIGAKHVSVVDVAAHQMTVFTNDVPTDVWPISAGRSNLPTLGGTLYVPYKTYDVKMDSLTLGIPRNSPDGYYEDVFWNVAISVNGFYIHAAPWSVGAQGSSNVSHGCVNLSPDRARTFYQYSQIGDVVIVRNTPRVADAGDGEGDWQIPFAQWPNSGGAITSPSVTTPPGGV